MLTCAPAGSVSKRTCTAELLPKIKYPTTARTMTAAAAPMPIHFFEEAAGASSTTAGRLAGAGAAAAAEGCDAGRAVDGSRAVLAAAAAPPAEAGRTMVF